MAGSIDEVRSRPTARPLRRTALASVAVIGAALLWGAAAAATTVRAEETVTPEPTLSEGIVTACQGDDGPGETKVDAAGASLLGSQGATGDAGTGTVTEDGTTLSVTINSGFTATAIVVVGQHSFNVYNGPFVGPIVVDDMPAPFELGSVPEISITRWFVCGEKATPTSTTTSTTSASTTTTAPATTNAPANGTATTTTQPPSTTTAATTSALTTTGPATTTAPTLPRTGGSAGGLVAVGVALVAGGAGALLLLRRRSDAAASQ